MKINPIGKEILNTLRDGNPVNRVDLCKRFGHRTKIIIAGLAIQGLIEAKKGIITISEAGKAFTDNEFCDACGCTPCDCGYGSY